MTYVITGPCTGVNDNACVGECPAGSIYEGQRMLHIHPGECTDGGACEAACPAEAAFYEDDVPRPVAQFTTGKVRFFSDRPAAPPRPARCPTAPATSPATSPAAEGAVARPTAPPGAAPRSR